jgi:hypothetical protein
MATQINGLRGLIALSLVVLLPAKPTFGLSEVVARKCLEMTLKAFPRPREWRPYKPGNRVTALARQAYYRDCVAKDGKI